RKCAVTDRAYSSSVRHGVDHEVQADTDGVAGILFGITLQVHEFPRVADVGVVSDCHHQSPAAVKNSINAGFGIARLLPGSAADATLILIRRLNNLVDIKKSMKYRMRQWYLLNRILRKHF